MAGPLFSGGLVSGLANVVLDRLSSHEFVLVWGNKLVERLRTAIRVAEDLAANIEQEQFGNELVRNGLIVSGMLSTLLMICWTMCSPKPPLKGEELAKRESSLGLIFIPTGSPSLRLRPPSTSLVKRNVFGRDGDQQALIKMLNDNNHHNLSVISIVGMAGVEYYKRISWGVCSLDSFDLLQQDLKEKLLGKKFFIVLDDVWSEDADKWNSFITPFQHGRKGSTILLTTRKKDSISSHYFVMDDILHELAIHLAGEFHCNLENLGENEEIKIQTRNAGRNKQIGKLAILSSFVAGKHEDNGIQEVGGLANLHGSFEIKKLENVVDVSQGRSARIIDKTHIDELCLEWSSAANVVQNTETERDILESLQAHDDLKCISGVLQQLLQAAFTWRVVISKVLRIERFDQLRSIGMELYKNEGDHHSSHIPPFPSLETLEFHDMPSWEEWHLPDFETFPQLQKLQLTNCPMLKGDMLNGVFLRMVSSLSDGLEVRKLHISEVPEGWNQEMILNGYTLSIKGCVSVVDSAFKAMSNNHLSHLQEMHISGCWSGLSFPGNSLPRSLQKLKIMDCRKLEFPSNSRSRISMSEPPHAALQRLTINGCHKLVSFAGEGLAAPNLTHLSITYCDKLEAFPSHMNTLLPSSDEQMKELSWMANLGALTKLTMDFSCVRSFTQVGLLPCLPSLTTLHLCYFQNLETLECNQLLGLTSLQQLHISYCPKLEKMEGEKLPSSLSLLKIQDCDLLGELCKNNMNQFGLKFPTSPPSKSMGNKFLNRDF
ncbi:Putative disease resistance RPP13-like protein [Arachis hypogaea]|nr:Putative disease resistance RPP13-like protein [Arachis hypogaea]